MKLVIAGGRDLYVTNEFIDYYINLCNLMPVNEVVCGECTGIDSCGELWAKTKGITVKPFPANWVKGKSAGPARNREMALYADVLLLIWDTRSVGSKNMLSQMTKLAKPVFEVVPTPEYTITEKHWKTLYKDWLEDKKNVHN